jgi:hypothetical protein
VSRYATHPWVLSLTIWLTTAVPVVGREQTQYQTAQRLMRGPYLPHIIMVALRDMGQAL